MFIKIVLVGDSRAWTWVEEGRGGRSMPEAQFDTRVSDYFYFYRKKNAIDYHLGLI